MFNARAAESNYVNVRRDEQKNEEERERGREQPDQQERGYARGEKREVAVEKRARAGQAHAPRRRSR